MIEKLPSDAWLLNQKARSCGHRKTRCNHKRKDQKMVNANKRKANYDKFIAKLTELTRKYGVAIQSVGGVYVADDSGEFQAVTYVADITSGDLFPRLQGD
jgi:hypothetical protein